MFHVEHSKLPVEHLHIYMELNDYQAGDRPR